MIFRYLGISYMGFIAEPTKPKSNFWTDPNTTTLKFIYDIADNFFRDRLLCADIFKGDTAWIPQS